MVRSILFDLDGVIIDSEPLHEEALSLVFDHFGFEVSDSFLNDIKGRTDIDVVREILELHPDNQLDTMEVVALKQRTYDNLIGRIQLMPGVREFIEQVQGQYRLALTTSASSSSQAAVFERFDLGRYFEVVVTAEDITRTKPDPEPYLVTVQRLGLSGESCLVIEDSVNGVRSAAAAGCLVAGYTTSFSSSILTEAGAHLTFHHFRDVVSWLDLDRSSNR